MSRPLFPNSVAYRPDGEPWAYAPFALELLTTPAVRTSAAYPTRPIYKFSTDANGAFATDLTINTPETGAWLWRLWWPDRRYIDAYIEQGDGSAIEMDDWVTLAGLSGSAAGTPAAEWLNGLYTAVSGADDGKMLETDGGNLTVSGAAAADVPSAGEKAWLTAAAARVADGDDVATRDTDGTTGNLTVLDAAGNSVDAGYAASQSASANTVVRRTSDGGIAAIGQFAAGVDGRSIDNSGVYGQSTNGSGVSGYAPTTGTGVTGTSASGTGGQSTSTSGTYHHRFGIKSAIERTTGVLKFVDSTAATDRAAQRTELGLGTAALAAAGDFDAAGAAAAAQAAAIAASVSKAGDTMAGLLQFSGTGHAGIKLNALTAAQRDALAAAAGMVIFNSDAGEPCYHDGIVWRQFSDNALALPLELDFTEMSDGALPTIFTAPTFTISSGKATNNPVLGSELLTNPGLEGAYTSGLSPNLTKTGSPTVAESADAHGGASAQRFTGAAFNDRLNWPTFAGVAGAWYKFSLWAKRTAGTAANTNMIAEATGNIPSAGGSQRIFGSSWQQEAASFITTGTANVYIFPAREATGGGSYDTVIVDDGSVKRITYADLFALFDSGDRTAITKAQPSPLVDGTLSAVVAWAGSASSPDTYVMAYWRYRSQKDRISFGMIKCVSGTYTSLIAEQSAVTVTDAWLEIRPVSSTQVALYYNNVQIGTTQTVNDCPGSYAGFLVSGGNNIKRFFVVAP